MRLRCSNASRSPASRASVEWPRPMQRSRMLSSMSSSRSGKTQSTPQTVLEPSGSAAVGEYVLTPHQCTEARKLLGWTQVRLAALAGVSREVVRLFENGARTTSKGAVQLIRFALETEGVDCGTSWESEPRLRVRT
ncbi:helix-turn-helix domain-containing protein [Roseomonas sp. BN140053]|uniref:helix-turn-helix domain-containing protein n=1 Tax=Roseomonas sp. BN140053 TaxID=3391898 RepID=UPI0039EA939E